jgi:hypothetical protein
MGLATVTVQKPQRINGKVTEDGGGPGCAHACGAGDSPVSMNGSGISTTRPRRAVTVFMGVGEIPGESWGNGELDSSLSLDGKLGLLEGQKLRPADYACLGAKAHRSAGRARAQ